MDVTAWPQLELVEQILEGNRNTVWRGELAGSPVSVRQSRRSTASLRWELELIAHLDSLDFRVPVVIPAADGEPHRDGVVVQRWLAGSPPASESDWALVTADLQRLHEVTAGYSQRQSYLLARPVVPGNSRTPGRPPTPGSTSLRMLEHASRPSEERVALASRSEVNRWYTQLNLRRMSPRHRKRAGGMS